MSGGHFNYGYSPYELEGQWQDAEINELYSDLFLKESGVNAHEAVGEC